MPETQTNTQTQNLLQNELSPASPFAHRIKVNRWYSKWLQFVDFSNKLLVFFSLRQQRKFWGVIYDSVTKQPLDPVIVKIAYAESNHTETCVTDLAGKYGFLAHQGRFKILPKKTNYIFPSKIVSGDKDGIYDNLYHGEFFDLDNDYEVVGPNIPMDPVQFDWNQTAKLTVVKTHPYKEYFFKSLIAIFFWFVCILDILYIVGHYQQQPIWAYALLGLYVLLLLLALVTPELRLWGEVRQQVLKNGKILLELHNPELGSVSFGKAEVHDTGKFMLRANPGNYMLAAKYQDFRGTVYPIGEVPVLVGSEGVVNQTLLIL